MREAMLTLSFENVPTFHDIAIKNMEKRTLYSYSWWGRCTLHLKITGVAILSSGPVKARVVIGFLIRGAATGVTRELAGPIFHQRVTKSFTVVWNFCSPRAPLEQLRVTPRKPRHTPNDNSEVPPPHWSPNT